MNILESREDYLERVLMLQKNGNRVRAIDIAKSMGYSKPSVSIALKKLREAGMITVDENGYLALTDEGKEIAKAITEKPHIFKPSFHKLVYLENICKVHMRKLVILIMVQQEN